MQTATSRCLTTIALVLLMLAQAQSATGEQGTALQTSIAAIPIFRALAAKPELRSYSVPVQLDITIHKLFFSFGFRRHGEIRYLAPDTLIVSLASVPRRYTDVFGLLGTMRTWPIDYALHVDGSTAADGSVTYRVDGAPRSSTDVESFSVLTGDLQTPLAARWTLHSGWTIASVIEPQTIGGYLLPKHDTIDIAGHGVKIHCEMAFGPYVLDDTPQ